VKRLSIVKKPVVIWTLAAVMVLIAVLVIAFVPGQQRVSLTLLNYRWSHGAVLKLSNDSRRTIIYLTDRDGGVSLFMQKTPGGWTNTSIPMTRGMINFNPATGVATPTELWFYYRSSSPRIESARSRELKPGQSAEVYVGLEPDGLPTRVGIMCYVPLGPVEQRMGQWIWWIKQRCHMKSRPPSEIEVWCSEPLQVSAKPERLERE